MTLRTKLLTIVVPSVALTFAACAYLYLRSTQSVEAFVREEEGARAAQIAERVEQSLRVYDAHVVRLAKSPSLGGYVRHLSAQAQARPPEDVRANVAALLADGRLAAIICIGRGGLPLFRATAAGIQTEDFIKSTVRTDERVWGLRRVETLRSQLSQESYGSALRLTAPVFTDQGDDGQPSGALAFEINLGALFEDAVGVDDLSSNAGGRREAQSLIAVERESGFVVYHTNEALRNQIASAAMPYFESVRARMAQAEADTQMFDAPDGNRWLAAFRRVGDTNISVAAVGDYMSAAAPARRAGLFALALVALVGIASVTLIFFTMTRASRRIERIAEGAAAIAQGNLDQRVDVEASGATRALAESFNLMSERLREHIAREAETKQFESFMRLSAMLTHDLKNAITGLSMLVSNMDRFYDREEFRADAISSLREATDKLKRIVARLNEPAKSLSGEYRRDARQTDLVPIINRVLAMNAVPSSSLYEIETRMPQSLVATVEPERIENVIENLVINALEAMGVRGGRLTVEAGEAGEASVFFSIADTGPGMSEEFIRERLFRPFATTKSKGIGLGLFTCREVVEAHGGRLEVDSRAGAGTRFRVVLPSAPFTSRERQRQTEKKRPAAAISGEHA